MSDVQMTHSDDCWKWHHECAKLAVEELAIDKERLRAENERLVKEVEHWREARRTALLAGDILKSENERLRVAGVGYSQRTVGALTKDRDALQVEAEAFRVENDRLRAENERLARARAIVDEQAEDEGLWFAPITAAEAYLQQELRRLHAAVEGERDALRAENERLLTIVWAG